MKSIWLCKDAAIIIEIKPYIQLIIEISFHNILT